MATEHNNTLDAIKTTQTALYDDFAALADSYDALVSLISQVDHCCKDDPLACHRSLLVVLNHRFDELMTRMELAIPT